MDEARSGVQKGQTRGWKGNGKNVKQGQVADQNGHWGEGGTEDTNARDGWWKEAVGGCLEMSFRHGRKEAKRRKGERRSGGAYLRRLHRRARTWKVPGTVAQSGHRTAHSTHAQAHVQRKNQASSGFLV